jgi:DNA-binding transcriptional LysR family regulator
VLAPAGVQPGRVMEIPLTEAIIEMVAAGAGIAFLACWSVSPHLVSRKIVGRTLGDPDFAGTGTPLPYATGRRPPI